MTLRSEVPVAHAGDRAIGSSRSPRTELGIGLSLCVTVLALYAPALRFDFIAYDDDQYVTANPPVQGGLSASGLRWAFGVYHAGNWHPVTWLSHMVDISLFGMNPGGHHATSVCIHAANALLLFLVLARATGAVVASACVAFLFAVHPLNVQSVAWVAERKNVLSTFFWFAALGAYVRYARRPGWVSYTWVVGWIGLGLMAKPMLVTAPFLFLLWDYWPLGRWGGSSDAAVCRVVWRLVWEKSPMFLLAAAAALWTVRAQSEGGALPTYGAALGTRIGNALVSYWIYLGHVIWPNELSFFYPYPNRIPWQQVLLAALGLVVVSLAAFGLARRYPFLCVGWFWFLGTLVPVIGLVQVGMQAMADRYMYVPMVGLWIAVVWGAVSGVQAFGLRTRWVAMAAGCVVVVYAIAARRELCWWRDSETLFARAIALCGENSVAHNNLGVVRAQQRRDEEAEDHFRRAVRADPERANPHVNLGLALSRRGRFEAAALHLAQALRIEPGNASVVAHLIAVLERSGRQIEGRERFAQAFEWQPDRARAARDIAWVLATHPDDELRDGREAVRLAERASELTGGGEAAMLDVLAAAYAEAGRYGDAAAAATRAAETARAAGLLDLEQTIRARIELYSQSRPYREPLRGGGIAP